MLILSAIQSSVWYKIFITLGTAMLPVIELRGAIPVGVAFGFSNLESFIISYIGNLIPLPFIILFIRKIFEWMKKREGKLANIARKMEEKGKKHEPQIRKYGPWGLLIFVAIPLPGTGGWTGALIAALMNMRMKVAMPIVALGVLIAGVIVTILTAGVTFFVS